jgi:hypothetical protein
MIDSKTSCILYLEQASSYTCNNTLLTMIYPRFVQTIFNLMIPTSVQSISITKTLLIVPTKNERDPPLFTGKLLIKFQNIMINTTQVIIRHRVKILFSVISGGYTGFTMSVHPSVCRQILCRTITWVVFLRIF